MEQGLSSHFVNRVTPATEDLIQKQNLQQEKALWAQLRHWQNILIGL